MSSSESIEEHIAQVESVLQKYLPEETGPQRTVIEAMNYSLLGGGKRIRPMLMQETFRMFGGDSKVVEPFMAAIEMIHTYSLIHDDLPAMDDDDIRRGRETNHIRYGEAMAILAGDGLLNLAFETALRAADMDPDNENVIESLRILAESSGIYGMLGGQAVDVETEGTPLDADSLDFIYEKKTGALIEAAMRIGAVLGGADPGQQDLICRAARDIGLAFQIRDDILDVTGNAQEFGKPIGSDAKNGKFTYVSLRGADCAEEDVEHLSTRARETLASLPVKNEFLEDLIDYLITRQK